MYEATSASKPRLSQPRPCSHSMMRSCLPRAESLRTSGSSNSGRISSRSSAAGRPSGTSSGEWPIGMYTACPRCQARATPTGCARMGSRASRTKHTATLPAFRASVTAVRMASASRRTAYSVRLGPASGAYSLARATNSSSVKSALAAARLGGRLFRASRSSVTGTSARRVTSDLERIASSLCPISPSRYALRLILSAFARTLSSGPNSFTRSRAPFSPMPGTPGTLSTLSPTRARTSTTRSGGTPHLSSTVLRS